MSNPSLWAYFLAFVFISVIVITYGGQHDFGKVRFNEVDVKGSLETQVANVDTLSVTGGTGFENIALNVTGFTNLVGPVNTRGLAIGPGLPDQDVGYVINFDPYTMVANVNNGSLNEGNNASPDSGTITLPPARAGVVTRLTLLNNLRSPGNGYTWNCQGQDLFTPNQSLYANFAGNVITSATNSNALRYTVANPANNNNYMGNGTIIDFVCTVDGFWDIVIRPRYQGTGEAGAFSFP